MNGIGLGWSWVRFKAKADQKVWKRWKEELSAAEDGNLRSEKKANKNKPLENIQGGWKGDISPYKIYIFDP